MLRTRLSVCYLPIEQLKPDPRNTRVHNKKQVRQIASSIESFGFNVPILIDGGNNVVAGHGRILAAKLLGLAEVPTVRLDHLTGAQRRAFAIADNRLTEIASWDNRLLGETLKELASVDLDFALEATGFDIGEIDLRIEALSQNEHDPAERPIPAVSGPAVTRTGDLWLMGRHKVLCGDALDAEAYRTLLGSETAAAGFTDPPYNVPVDGHVSGRGQTRHREFPMAGARPFFDAGLNGQRIGRKVIRTSPPCTAAPASIRMRTMSKARSGSSSATRTRLRQFKMPSGVPDGIRGRDNHRDATNRGCGRARPSARPPSRPPETRRQDRISRGLRIQCR